MASRCLFVMGERSLGEDVQERGPGTREAGVGGPGLRLTRVQVVGESPGVSDNV